MVVFNFRRPILWNAAELQQARPAVNDPDMIEIGMKGLLDNLVGSFLFYVLENATDY